MQQQNNYQLVDMSPWPIITGTNMFLLLTSVVLYIHSVENGLVFIFCNIISLLFCMFVWWRDVIREGTYLGKHTLEVQKSLAYGMLLFILSEVCFFVAFFWGFFHSSMSPTIEIGSVWPPENLVGFNPWLIPLLNTVILLSSGATITWAHHEIIGGNLKNALLALESTIGLAILFTLLQIYEYVEANFNIMDGIYGTTFFMATGFHGFHVFIGTIILSVMLLRLYNYHFTREHHFGFEAGAWYWHFVDVVWLFLYVSIYWWGAI